VDVRPFRQRPPTDEEACSRVGTNSGESWLLCPGADAPYGDALTVRRLICV